MNNILISAVRLGIITGIALLAFAGEVFAAPVLTPVTATTFSATSVMLAAKVSNPVWVNTSVWFEWGEAGSQVITAGLADVYNQGPFETLLTDLKPGITYFFRAGAMDVDSNVTVYSPTAYFTIRDGSVVLTTLASVNTYEAAVSPAQVNTSDTSAGEVAKVVSAAQEKKVAPATAAKKIVSAPAVKSTATTIAATASNTDNSGNLASVAGADSVLPSTLVGWIALITALLFAVLLARMIFESSEKRKKASEDDEMSHRTVRTREEDEKAISA